MWTEIISQLFFLMVIPCVYLFLRGIFYICNDDQRVHKFGVVLLCKSLIFGTFFVVMGLHYKSLSPSPSCHGLGKSCDEVTLFEQEPKIDSDFDSNQ